MQKILDNIDAGIKAGVRAAILKRNDQILFRELDQNEMLEFKKWARENYKAGEHVSSLWHPVVRAECEQINWEEKPI
jgi:hypothetical protein